LCLSFSILACVPVLALDEGTYASSPELGNWSGLYNTSIRSINGSSEWIYPDTLIVIWGKEVQNNGTVINGVNFLNNSSIAWSMDPKWGSGQIWFMNGDNRSYYWPDGSAKGKVFTGWIQPTSSVRLDFKGKNDANYTLQSKPIACEGCAGGKDATIQCGNCSNGKVCSSGKCICPYGTVECGGYCVTVDPCGGCDIGRTCVNGKCVCPEDMKECNGECLSKAECCGGCPPWKTCANGKCVCPPGEKECNDPMPL